MVHRRASRLWYAAFSIAVLAALLMVALPPLPGVAAGGAPPAVLTAVADTYVRAGAPNTNEGASPIMRLQASGDNRSLVRFDQAAIAGVIGGGVLVSAKLQVDIVKNANNWGKDGRTIDVHRLSMGWVEGNGKNAELPARESFRGTGAGATWNLAIDTDIANSRPDGDPENDWDMRLRRRGPNDPPWQDPPTASLLITKNLTGTLEFDVTADVAAFLAGTPNYGWIIKKTQENQAGHLDLASRENGTQPGPRLVLTHNYLVNFTAEGNGVPASVTYSINGGAPVTVAAPATAVVPDGGNISYSYPTPLAAGAGTRYVLTATSPLSPQTISSNLTVKGTYKKQYQLSLGVNPSTLPGGMANVTGGSDGTFYDDGTVLSLAAATPVADGAGKQWRFDSWSGDAAGSANPVSVTMNAPRNVTATYVAQYYLTVSDGGHGAATGHGWYDAGVAAAFSISPTTVAGSPGTQYLFTGWNGSGSGSYTGGDASKSVTMNNPVTEAAQWKTQYYLAVNSAYGTTGGAGWYDSGAAATATVTPLTLAGGPGTQYVFTNWGGDASGTASASNPITMDAPKTANANWKTQYQLSLAVNPSTLSGGVGNISGGANDSFYDSGAVLALTAGPVSGYLFDSWTGDASGTVNPVSVTMSAPRSVTAVYRPAVLTLSSPLRDSFLRSGSDNTNEGANPGLRIQGNGDNRILAAFNLSGVDISRVTRATLTLNIYEKRSGAGPDFWTQNWGTAGRTLSAYRLLADWTEGNGSNSDVPTAQIFRGTGHGVTWNLPDDPNISNGSYEGLPRWGGGDGQPSSNPDFYTPTTGPAVLIVNDQVGDISFDVTADVRAGAGFGWLIKKTVSADGQVHFRSRENPDGPAPRLVIEFAP